MTNQEAKKFERIGEVIFWAIVLLFIAFNAPAQNQRKQEVVYLKNGSVIRGKIIEQDSTQIKIETRDMSYFVCAKNDIDKITLENHPFYQIKKGYLNYLEIGILPGSNDPQNTWVAKQNYTSLTIQTFQGYQFHRLLALGATTGLDFYASRVILPILGGLRGDLTKRRITPFYSLDFGYGFDWLNDRRDSSEQLGGFLWNTAIGLKIRTLHRTAFNFSIGFRSQKIKTIEYTFDGGNNTYNYTFQRIALRMGASF